MSSPYMSSTEVSFSEMNFSEISSEEFRTEGGVLVDERTVEQTEAGDHERFAHYVQKDKIVESAVLGAPVIALCGKVWVPSRDPGKFPVCPDCKNIYEGLPVGGGDKSNED